MATDDQQYTFPAELLPVFRLLLSGHTRAAEALLREHHFQKGFWAQHKARGAVVRVEEVFTRLAGSEPWPSDLTDQHRKFWRLKLAGLLLELPVALAIEDLKASAVGKSSLIYYLSSERGTRASRWEMLIHSHRDALWQKEKQAERAAAEEFFPDGVPFEVVVPEWVTKNRMMLKVYRAALADQTTPIGQRGEMQQSIGKIRAALAHHGFTEE